MKAATVKQLKDELSQRTREELLEYCLRLSKFKKENKEFLTYLLYDIDDENSYIEDVKQEIRHQFTEINLSSYYFIKKSTRKILRNTKKYIRYSKKKETEVELLMHFCKELSEIEPPMQDNVALYNIFLREINSVKKTISTLHEDLQYDYNEELNEILEKI
jgi:hypothetical protein